MKPQTKRATKVAKNETLSNAVETVITETVTPQTNAIESSASIETVPIEQTDYFKEFITESLEINGFYNPIQNLHTVCKEQLRPLTNELAKELLNKYGCVFVTSKTKASEPKVLFAMYESSKATIYGLNYCFAKKLQNDINNSVSRPLDNFLVIDSPFAYELAQSYKISALHALNSSNTDNANTLKSAINFNKAYPQTQTTELNN